MSKTVRTRHNYGLSAENFSMLFNSSVNADEAVQKITAEARKLGKLAEGESIPKNVVLARASVYRTKNKINLKFMNGGRPGKKIDVDAINAKLAAMTNLPLTTVVSKEGITTLPAN